MAEIKRHKSWMCKCGKEFTDYETYNEHKKTCNPKPEEKKKEVAIEEPKVADKVAIEEPVQRFKPPRLEYKYSGRCSTCTSQVETIALEDMPTKSKCTVVAWCPKCNIKVSQQIVNKIK